MKTVCFYFLIILNQLTFVACGQTNTQLVNPQGNTIKERFKTPENYTRINSKPNTFQDYLQNLPLKPHGSKVKHYNGNTKSNDVYEAVVNLTIGNKNLHQCADAVIRLRAEYFYNQKNYNQIKFHFTNGFLCEYSKWMQGYRVNIQGNKTNWVKNQKPSQDYKSFWKYLELVFSYAGTLSLSKELKTVEYKNMQIGDVFIQGGSPGHAVIVVDMAIDNKGNKMFMLAQSYMPAQDLQILKNENQINISPWYKLNLSDNEISTPEWNFTTKDLKRFENE